MADIDKKDTSAALGGGKGVSRREFLTGVGGLGLGTDFGGALFGSILLPDKGPGHPGLRRVPAGGYEEVRGLPELHDGMLAHPPWRDEPVAFEDPNHAGSVWEVPRGHITISQCRQCPYPSCVEACPPVHAH